MRHAGAAAILILRRVCPTLVVIALGGCTAASAVDGAIRDPVRAERRLSGKAANAASFAELQRELLARDGDVDLFRARGPFSVAVQNDRELRISASERVRTDFFLASPAGKAPLVIFVHGHESSKAAHAKQAAHVASWGMHAITVQLPNKGPWLANGQILSRLVAVIARAPDAIDARVDASRIVLVGHSFGAVAACGALGEGAQAIGGILLDPAAIAREVPDMLRRVRKPVLVVGADEEVSPARNRDHFFDFIRSGVAEVSIRDAAHEDAQYPSDQAIQSGAPDPNATEELQVTFVSALTAAAMSLAATATFEWAWASFRPALQSGRLFDPKKK